MRVAAGYRWLAPHYDATRDWWAGHRLGAAEAFLEEEVLPRYLPPGADVLDLGCGTGANLERLLRLGIPFGQYAGVDLSPAMVARARGKALDQGRAEFYLGDMRYLPFEDATFDFALSTWALEHVPQVDTAIAEACRVLKSEAYLCLTFFSLPDSPWSIAARLVEPSLKVVLHMQLVRSTQSAPDSGIVLHKTFARGLQTLVLLRKGAAG